MSATDLITNSGLPAEIQELIRQVVKRSRLWKRERQVLTVELLAHFRDGLAAGGSADYLVKRFGDVKVAARLMRRAKKRNRPLWWRTGRRMLQAASLFVLAYIGLALLLSMRHPNPRTDYLALLNASASKASESDRAWPIYRKAWIEADLYRTGGANLYKKDADGRPTPEWLNPGDADWPQAIAYLDQHKALLSALREAGLKPSLGFTAARQQDFSEDDRTALGMAKGRSAAFSTDRSTNDAATSLLSDSLIAVLLPHLSLLRISANVLSRDMVRAASEGDGDRIAKDYQAMLGMAMQAREQPIVINQLVSLGIAALADRSLLDVHQEYPGILAHHHVDLLHGMTAIQSVFDLDLSGEKMFFDDMIQRVYSDDGHGDGTLTVDGIRLMSVLGRVTSGGNATPVSHSSRSIATIYLPLAVSLTGSRNDLQNEADRFYAAADRDVRRPLWIRLRTPSEADQLLLQWKSSALKNAHLMLLTVLAPAANSLNKSFDTGRALHEAAKVVLVLDTYKTKEAHYPSALTDLVPHYLPTAPLDYSTGGPLHYKLMDGQPLLYGLGKDGVDDGGVWTDKKTSWPKLPDIGDWVLYPPPPPAR